MHGWALQDASPAGPSLQWTHNHAHALQRTRQHKFMSIMWGAVGVPLPVSRLCRRCCQHFFGMVGCLHFAVDGAVTAATSLEFDGPSCDSFDKQ